MIDVQFHSDGIVGFNWGEVKHGQFFILQRSSGCNVDTGENKGRLWVQGLRVGGDR